MTSSRPLRADAQRNRDALIVRARELFAAGDEELRFDDFARLAGVGTGTLYRHFPTREILAAAVFQQESKTLCQLAATLHATLPAGEALEAFLRGMVEHIGVHQRLTRRLVTLLAASADEVVRSGQDLERAVTALVVDAIEEGDIRNDVPAGAVMMTLHGIGGAQDRPGWRREADDVITLLLDGLRSPTATRQETEQRQMGLQS